MGESRRDRTGELLATLAHEFRNPLASLQGCAMTLLERRDSLAPDMQDGLTRVIVSQSQRLDWLVRAAAAYGGAGGRDEGGTVDTSIVVLEAGEFTETKIEVGSGAVFEGDPRRVRLALEAILLTLRGAGAETDVRLTEDGRVLDIVSTARDLGQGERRWKLDLARTLLREEGCALTIRRSADGTVARVRFAVSPVVRQEVG